MRQQDTTLEECWSAPPPWMSDVPPADRVAGSYAPGREGQRRMALGCVLAAYDGNKGRMRDLLEGRSKRELMDIIALLAHQLTQGGVPRQVIEEQAHRAAGRASEL